MSTNIVIAKLEGVGSGTTLYGTPALAKAAGNGKLYWNTLEMSTANSWESVVSAGFSSIDPKWMGGKTNQITIKGFIVDPADSLANIIVGMRGLLRLNRSRMSVTVKLGATFISEAGPNGAIVLLASAGPIGDGTGPECPFSITFKNIGPDSDTPAI